MRQLIISCSLSPTSSSAVLAEKLLVCAKSLGDECTMIDLRQRALPLCDAGPCYEHSDVKELQSAIGAADAITIATPIYNYETGGGTRNLIALTGQAWTEKVVSFMCAAGGQGSYMAVMGLANSLMLDFRCLIVPRFVYATGESFTDGVLSDEKLEARIAELAAEMHRVSSALKSATS